MRFSIRRKYDVVVTMGIVFRVSVRIKKPVCKVYADRLLHINNGYYSGVIRDSTELVGKVRRYSAYFTIRTILSVSIRRRKFSTYRRE
jgi:hypothetical protein